MVDESVLKMGRWKDTKVNEDEIKYNWNNDTNESVRCMYCGVGNQGTKP